MDHCCSNKRQELEIIGQDRALRHVLTTVMAINLVMFVVEFGAGLIAHSSALQADAVDMLGDAIVYALSLWAIGRGPRWDAGAALLKGMLILAFFVFVVVGISNKLMHGVMPTSSLMLGFGLLALAGNLTCLTLLWRFRRLNLNMKSTFECSRNDVLANTGVVTAGAVVGITGHGWPDILIASIIAILFLHSAIKVISEAWPEWQRSK